MTYQIKLPVFEGPLDLLLYLIKKNEVDVYDIPIADIVHQYLEYLELMKILDLDIAGEFIEMAATLMLIKVRMLLPRYTDQGEEIIEDPRRDLVEQLLEYQRFKEAGTQLGELEYRRRQYFARPARPPETVAPHEESFEDVSLFDLLTAFKRALDNMPRVTVHQVNIIKVTIEDQVDFLFRQIGEKPYALFRDLVKPLRHRMELIVTFIALLDLMRLKFLTAKQTDIFGEIRLVPLRPLEMADYRVVRSAQREEKEAVLPEKTEI